MRAESAPAMTKSARRTARCPLSDDYGPDLIETRGKDAMDAMDAIFSRLEGRVVPNEGKQEVSKAETMVFPRDFK